MVKRAWATDRSQPASAWRERFVRYASSKQTVEAFCLGDVVSVASFYGWRTRLRDGRVNGLTAPRTVPLPAASPFIDLGPVSADSIRTTASRHAPAPDYAPTAINLRLDLGGGVVLHIARH